MTQGSPGPQGLPGAALAQHLLPGLGGLSGKAREAEGLSEAGSYSGALTEEQVQGIELYPASWGKALLYQLPDKTHTAV